MGLLKHQLGQGRCTFGSSKFRKPGRGVGTRSRRFCFPVVREWWVLDVFPTCQVRVLRFYQSCPLLLLASSSEPDKMLERMSATMPEDMHDRISEYMPEYARYIQVYARKNIIIDVNIVYIIMSKHMPHSARTCARKNVRMNFRIYAR